MKWGLMKIAEGFVWISALHWLLLFKQQLPDSFIYKWQEIDNNREDLLKVHEIKANAGHHKVWMNRGTKRIFRD